MSDFLPDIPGWIYRMCIVQRWELKNNSSWWCSSQLRDPLQSIQAERPFPLVCTEHYFNKHMKFKPIKSINTEILYGWMIQWQRKKLDPNWTGPYLELLYKQSDLRHPQAGSKVVHYDQLKPYRSTWYTSSAHIDTLPTYTALTGSFPLHPDQPDTGQASVPACSTVPLLCRPSGLVSQVPPQPNQTQAYCSYMSHLFWR